MESRRSHTRNLVRHLRAMLVAVFHISLPGAALSKNSSQFKGRNTMSEPQGSSITAFFSILMRDVYFGLRQLKKSPGFAAVVIGSLALGIGASVAVFSVVRAVLLDPYPYKDADRMVHVELKDKTSDRQTLLYITADQYKDLLQLKSVDEVFLQDDRRQALTGESIPTVVAAGFYSPNLFTYMGVPPVLGREFTPSDVSNGTANRVAVLGYLFWKKQYGGRLDILGKTLELDHTPYTVIGVASPRFTWGDSDAYIPEIFKPDPHNFVSPFLKLKPGVTREAAAAELQPLVNAFAKQNPTNFPQNAKVTVKTLNEEVLHGFQGPLLLLFAAVLLLLLIGCSNVSILMLARGAVRQHEFALRSSIGATRSRIIRQLLTESVLLSCLGAAAGILIAYRGVAILAAHLPQDSFPREAAIQVNGTVLLFAVAIAIITGILFGLSPAWQLSRPDVGAIMQGTSGRLANQGRARHTHRILIAGQVALTMLMLAGAGAAIRAFLDLYHSPLGFQPDHLFFMSVAFQKGPKLNWDQMRVRQEAVRQAAESTPGVTSASISTTWTPPFGGYRTKIAISSKPSLTDAQADLGLLSFNEFSTLEIPLLSGRFFTQEEDARAAHVALVNRTFVKQYMRDGNVIGTSVRSPGLKLDNPNLLSATSPDGWLEIIGVVDDARNDGLDRPVKPAVYLPQSMIIPPNLFLIMRAKGNTADVMHSLGVRLHQLDPELFVQQQNDVNWLLETQAWGRERFLASLFALFAVLALLLSAAGIYSVVSYTVSQRTREFGVRMALGANRLGVVRMVLQSSLTTVAAGAAIGILLSLALGKLLVTSAHSTVRDPVMLISVSMVLLAITALACLYPAWRAASIDPIKAIRTE
jgi:predicted permease